MTAASAAGILAFVVGTAAVTAALFAFPQHRRTMLALMVFSICYVKKPFYQEVFFVDYRGVDRGFAVTIPDLFFFGFFFHMLLGGLRRRLVKWPLNSTLWFALVGVSCLSLAGSTMPSYGLFTIHKLVRCWVLYFVVVNAVADRRDLEAVLKALAASIVFEGILVFWAKYVTASVVARSVGSFRHPNTLAMYVDLISPALFGALLSGGLAKRANALLGAAIVAGLVCVVFTKSRGAMVLAPAALGLVAGASFLAKPTARKLAIVATGIVLASLLAAIAMPRIVRRFENAPKESAETREYFNEAARAMAHDRLFGVGINQYALSLARGDYYWYVYPDMVEVADPEAFRESVRGQSRLGTAHHIYWLYAAETGWIGLAVFVLHIGVFWILCAWRTLRERDPLIKGVCLGLLVSTSFHHLHGTLEWIFRQTEVLYLYFVLMGTVVASASFRSVAPARTRNAARRRPAHARVSLVPLGQAL